MSRDRIREIPTKYKQKGEKKKHVVEYCYKIGVECEL